MLVFLHPASPLHHFTVPPCLHPYYAGFPHPPSPLHHFTVPPCLHQHYACIPPSSISSASLHCPTLFTHVFSLFFPTHHLLCITSLSHPVYISIMLVFPHPAYPLALHHFTVHPCLHPHYACHGQVARQTSQTIYCQGGRKSASLVQLTQPRCTD